MTLPRPDNRLKGRRTSPTMAACSSNWGFRVGEDLAVRLPRSHSYTADVLTEAEFLPRLAPHLGFPVPEVRFLAELSALDLPPGSERWGYRAGEPVTDVIDGWVASAADSLEDLFDPGQVAEAWRRICDVPPASAPPCWVHTDLSVENILATAEGDLVGVLDFGGLGVGDRSVDLLYAWSMFDPPAREVGVSLR